MNINGIMVAGDLAGSSDSNVVISISGSSPINVTPNALQWAVSTTIPILGQTASATAAGQALTIQAQGSTGSGTNGGNLVLASGTSLSGSTGNVQLQSGATTNLTLLATGSLQFGSTITSPTISQVAAAAAGGNLSITAQSAGGTTNNGGSLVLTSGASSTTGTSGNVTINTATPGGGGTAANILFQINGTTQSFVTANASGAGLGIGTTPGTSPTITSGSGAPSSTEPNGSIYLNIGGVTTNSAIYTRQNGAWTSLITTGSQILPLTETITTNSSHSTYTVDSTGGGSDGIILHNYTASTTGYTYVMPAPTTGRQIIIRDITGGIETANTGGFITGSGTGSKVIFIAPHGTEQFNGSSGFTLSGGSTFNVSNNSPTVTCTTGLFTTQLAPGMSITFSAQSGVSYIISAIGSATSLTLTTNYTGTTSTTSTATMNSLAYYANYGTLTFISNGTNWFASSNKPLRAYITTITTGLFIPSPGCTSATLIGCGGGGGGGYQSGSTTASGGGGGGAIQTVMNVSLIPNTSYSTSAGAGGAAGSASAGGVGGNTLFGSSIFYGASGGGNGASNTTASGGNPFINGSSNVYTNSFTGLGATSIAAATSITLTTMPGMMGMGAGSNSTASAAGFINIMGNGSYTGGTTTGGGGGGAGPQGNGGNGISTGAAGSGAANSGAGGGGVYDDTGTSGAGGSGYLYIIMPM